MIKQIVATAAHNREIEKTTDARGQVTYRVRQGKQYIGKTADGGYKSKRTAIEAANR